MFPGSPRGGYLEYLGEDPLAWDLPRGGRGREYGMPAWAEWDHQRRPAQEDAFARALRRAQLGPFRRNARVGPYEVDFLFEQEGVAVELDGFTHLASSEQQRDRKKEAYLRQAGYRVVRFRNEEVRRSADACAQRLRQLLRTRGR